MPEYNLRDEVDFVIIGSGAAGGILAKELSTAGYSTVVLEQGKYRKVPDFTHDEIINLIRSDAAATDVFMAKMIQVGWTDELRRSGQLLCFHLRDAHIYEVDDHFPRLPAELVVPDGVVGIRYTIDLTNIPSLDVDDAIDIVRHGRP